MAHKNILALDVNKSSTEGGKVSDDDLEGDLA